MNIPYFKPYITGKEIKYIKDLLVNKKDLSGDGEYTRKVHSFLQKKYKARKVLLTTSGTTALEFAVRLLNLNPKDEVIVPSFTFSSTVNAILVSSNAKVVFAEIDEDTLNIDPKSILKKITKNTKAIIVVHYAGVACDMDAILKIAKKYKFKIIEDAAQAIESKYKGKYLGTIGDFGCLSFHDTKNITCGEGGALFINSADPKIAERAEVIREKGTNRTKFFRGEIDKYTWVDIGSSYLPSDILAAFLLAQLEEAEKITAKRFKIYDFYKSELSEYEKKGVIKLQSISKGIKHNAHIFYVMFKSNKERDFVLKLLKEKGIQASFHYIPLHSSPQGKKLGFKKSDFLITENVSGRLLRLPIYADMKKQEYEYVANTCKKAIGRLNEI